jgi:hypothetical protein
VGRRHALPRFPSLSFCRTIQQVCNGNVRLKKAARIA